jgi:hypothetical protein
MPHPQRERKQTSDAHYILALIGKPLHAVAIIRAAEHFQFVVERKTGTEAGGHFHAG